MPAPYQSDMHVSTPLTNVAIAYAQDASNFIASRVFPNIPVAKQADQYWIYNREDWNRDQAKKRAPGTESAGGGYELERGTYFADVYAFHKDIDDQVRANADSIFNLDRDATNFVTMKALLNREVSFVRDFLKPGIWQSGRIGVAAAPSGANEFLQWNDAGSTPIEDVRNAKRTVLGITGFVPNKLTLGVAVYDALLDHPDIIDRIKYGQTPGRPAMANEQILAQLFEVDEVLVARAIVNNATTGAAESNGFVFGYDALLSFAPATPSVFQPSAGYTFSWNGLLGSSSIAGRIKRFRLEAISSDRVEIEFAYDQVVTGADLGFFFEQAVNNPQSA